MVDSSHGSAHPFLGLDNALNRDNPCVSRAPCSGAMSDRLRKTRAAKARRAWIERRGAEPSATPVWLSRNAWLDDVRQWAESPNFMESRAAARVSIAPSTVVAVAVLWANAADHGTGRHAAVTRERIAAQLGVAAKTVSRAWTVLGAAGWAVEASRGHGTSSGHTAGNRPSIWHLVSRRPAAEAGVESAENVPLPPKAGFSLLSPVGTHSPSGRQSVRANISSDHTGQRRPGRRPSAAPRPLAVQRLAAELVNRCHGLHRGHIGAVCDALTGAGIDPAIWTPSALIGALNADMRTTGMAWPDQIERPGAFLAGRLRRLQKRHSLPSEQGGGCAAPGMDKGTPPLHRVCSPSRGIPVAPLVLTCDQKARIKTIQTKLRQQLAAARQTSPVAPDKAARPLVPSPCAQPLETHCCSVCGAVDAPRRRYLPPHRAHVCDGCWGADPGAVDYSR